MKRLPSLVLAGVLLTSCAAARADTCLGDWGHYLSYRPKIHLLNRSGRPFTVTVHVMRWPVKEWNRPAVKFRLVGPDNKPVHEGEFTLTDARFTLDVPGGGKGVYLLEPVEKSGANFWVSSSLDHAVVWTGDPNGHAVEGRRAVFQASVPRRWWFWVPPETKRFVCRAQRADRYMSQREDWGFFVVTPRGQRIRALWGQPPKTPSNDYRRDQEIEVEVEPGAAGRFWSVEVRLGDSHNYSNINFALDGVPPYLARSPEEWFDPTTGQRPQIPTYDDSPFIQSARIEPVMREHWPNTFHFSPCPSLGDPDGVEIVGDGRFALFNPHGRALNLRVGSYLPRHSRAAPATAAVTATGAGGKVVFQKDVPMEHIHGEHGHPNIGLRIGRGVGFVDVVGVERWLAFTYPATPTVLVGAKRDGDWRRFRVTVGTARNWYFFVPRKTAQFSVRASVGQDTDVMHFEVRAPDRTLALIYGREGEKTIDVPPDLDGKIWHLRPDVGSATRMPPGDSHQPRYLDLDLTVDIKGVPGYLAPTWEQWFDPSNPQLPDRR